MGLLVAGAGPIVDCDEARSVRAEEPSLACLGPPCAMRWQNRFRLDAVTACGPRMAPRFEGDLGAPNGFHVCRSRDNVSRCLTSALGPHRSPPASVEVRTRPQSPIKLGSCW